MRDSNLIRRAASAVVGVPLVVALIWAGHPWFLAGVLVVALLSVAELQRMAGLRLASPLGVLALVWSGLFMANAWWGGDYTLHLLAGAVILSLPLRQMQRRSETAPSWALTLVTLLYPAWLLGYFLLVRGGSQGREWVLLAVLATFAVDTTAYFTGRAWGRHRLAPGISPGKSWEGAAGGVVAGLVAALALVWLLGLPLAAGPALGLGLALAVAAVAGDLAESRLKRSFQVKDAGRLIPGHGGLLDRLDSLLFTIVVVYYYQTWFPT